MELAQLPSVFVTATDTDAGKTWTACRILSAWKAWEMPVAACKPVASGGVWHDGRLFSEDAQALAAVTGQDHDQVAPFVFEKPASPHIADTQGVFDPNACLAHIQRLQQENQRLLVEGVGGWCVPLSERMMLSEFVRAINLPVLLVVPIRLGCINHALLSAAQIQRDGCHLLGWYANRIEPGFEDYQANVAAIDKRIGVPRILD